MRSPHHFFALIAALVLVGCGGEEVEIETGYRGKARRDPFLAAERFLERNSLEVSTHTWLGDHLPPYATLIATAQSFGNRGTSDRVLDWVAYRGGNLIVLLDGGETFRDDWEHEQQPRSRAKTDDTKKQTWSDDEDDSPREQPERAELLEKLGIGEVTGRGGDLEVSLPDGTAKLKMPARFKWMPSRKPQRFDITAGDKDSIALASFHRGSGRITIAAHAEPFRNRHLGDGDNAWLLLRLVGKSASSEVWFLNGMRISFFGMLWEHGWMALLAAAVLLAVWLWRSIPRFGPLRAAEETGTRDFAEHLSLTGAFLWRYGQRAELIAPLREAVTRAAVRRGFNRNDGDFPEKLAAFAQMDPNRVDSALRGIGTAEGYFLRAVHDLRALREKLSA